ncbi:MAG TPA: sodium:solute symporter family protein [Candidatus Kapabacteria bacterium]|nr:sodium:solute symporter family protein [Candidatus Kapabacteria bacterium]
MRIWGLHILDWAIILLYVAVLIYIGRRTQRRIRSTSDFFQGGRSFGKVLTTFLNFGNMVSADQAAGVTREIYRQGLSGVWFQNLVLFITPFYWFSAVLQRRARYVGPGDIYEHRFESKFLSGLFAVYLLLSAIYGSSLGYLITGKTMQAVMIKPANECTLEERQKVVMFSEMKTLEETQSHSSLNAQSLSRLNYLHELSNRGEIVSSISYLDLTTFYLIYGCITAAYVIMGGLFAAAFTDVLQGIMIFFLSTALIPVGLHVLGGFEGLHRKVPDALFDLFGSGAGSNYTWYFVLTMVLVNLIGLAPRNFTVGGSAKDDSSARIGMVSGAFAKRLLIIGWALTGMIALALYGGTLSDATFIWGTMTNDLLGVGFVGLMIASVLAANMSSKAGSSLEWSAAFTKNILLPLRPGTSEKTQLLAGRIVIFLVLLGGIAFAYVVDDIFVVFKYVLAIGTVIGPSLWLVYFWRRLTTKAVVLQMCLSIFVTVIMPTLMPAITSIRTDPSLLRSTHSKTEVATVRAKESDVANGAAHSLGEKITKHIDVASTPIFFEKIEATDPADQNSKHIGIGTFKAELWLLSLVGFDFTNYSKAGLDTASFAFDIIFPFVILFLVSLLTKPNSQRVLREFYARVHTPSVADRAVDDAEVLRRVNDPTLIEKNKLFPHTNWEFWKPTRSDILGFLLSWVGVGVIVLLYIWIMSIGS